MKALEERPKEFITRHFTLDNIMDAYDVFSRAAATQALKVITKAA